MPRGVWDRSKKTNGQETKEVVAQPDTPTQEPPVQEEEMREASDQNIDLLYTSVVNLSHHTKIGASIARKPKSLHVEFTPQNGKKLVLIADSKLSTVQHGETVVYQGKTDPLLVADEMRKRLR